MRTDRSLAKKTVATYADVLLEAARDESDAFEMLRQLGTVVSTIKGHKDLGRTLADSKIPFETRDGILTDIFGDMGPALLTTLGIMVEHGDLGLLERLPDVLEQAIQEKLGTTIVDVTTAIPLDDELRRTIVDKLATEYGTRIHLEESVDPSIIGGIVMNALGQRIDASINTQLRNARLVLTTETTGGEG